ncbi:MAG: sulfatase-like hydrolase/transferase [Saccharofermentans sp.]|nr:sulfatase-like hydrolase/transferase [Saccharofermentans sp.]
MRRYEFILYVFFYEVVFGFSVYGFGYFASMPFTLLWSIILGAPAVILLMNLKGKILPIVDGLLRVLYAIPFLVEYFIYMQFKELYDLNTIMNGAGGALTGFTTTILGLIFSPLGVFHLFLYSIPLSLLVMDLKKKTYDYTQPDKQVKIGTAVAIPVCFVLNLIIIACIPSARTIVGAEYNYPKAVQAFGYMEGTALDIKALLFGSGGEFQNVKNPVHLQTSMPGESNGESNPGESLAPGESAPVPTPTPTHEPQVMDIDFASLQAKGGKIATLAQYCSNVEPTYTNKMTGKFKGKNLIMITAEAFTAEAIDPVLTPTLYRLATKGIQFTDSYVPATAGTTGGEFSHIFGLLPTSGGKSVTNMTENGCTYFTMGQRLNAEGYFGYAFHNNDYKYYSRNKTHTKLGYNQGFMGIYNGMEKWVNYHQWPESDYDMFVGTCPLYLTQDHFNIYYMSVSGHSGYTRAGNAMSKKHWDETASLEGKNSEAVRAYKACNMDLDQGLKYLVDRLEECGKADDTVICIVADHFPYGLDPDASLGNMPKLSELYGYEVKNYIQRDHNRIIMWSGCLEKEDPIVVDTPTSSIDILPTLMNLFGIKYDSRLLPGRDVFSDSMPLAFNLNYDWKTDLGTYYSSKGEFVPKDANTQIPDGYVQQVKSIVSNKIKYCKNMVGTDFIKQCVGDPNK